MSMMTVFETTAVASAAVIACNVPETDYPAWSASTTYVTGDRVISTTTHKVYEAVKAYEVASVTVTANDFSDGNSANWGTEHGFAANTQLKMFVEDGGVMPPPLVEGTTYFLKTLATEATRFQFAATSGGAFINLTGSGSGSRMVTAYVNFNKDPTVDTNRAGTTPYWREVSATNRWKMLDTLSSSQTENADSITLTLQCSRVNTLYLGGLVGESVSVQVKNTAETITYYDQTISLNARRSTGLWDYFFGPTVYRSSLALTDLPPFAGSSVRVLVTINYAGGTAKCGVVAPGLGREVGEVQWGLQPGIQDYSKKETNIFGDPTLEPGKTAKLLECDLFIDDNADLDNARDYFASLAGKACIFVGSDEYGCTQLCGFYRDFRPVLASPAGTFCALSLEELA